jgi:hypothetical protein
MKKLGRPSQKADPRGPELIRIYREIGNAETAAKRVGICYQKACDILRAHGEMRQRGVDWVRHVPEIRQALASGATIAELAKRYNRSKAAVWEAIRRHIKGPVSDQFRVCGRIGEPAAIVANQVASYVEEIGAATLICSRRGIIAAAIPGTRIASQAAAEGCVVATYTSEPRDPRHRMTGQQLRDAIAEDLAHEQRVAA